MGHIHYIYGLQTKGNLLYYIYQLIKILFLLTLPFILLIRGSIYLYQEKNFEPYLAIIGGAGITVFVLIIYFSFFYGRLAGRFGSFDSLKRRAVIALLLVFVYSFHGIFFFSSSNTKTKDVKSELLDLHPILRLSLSTLIHIDKDLIVTDAARKISDYDDMGLSRNTRSKHLKQSDGYVHAVDLRTKGRSEYRNAMMTLYFKMMGFETLRHSGTADHLHVNMPR